MQRASSPPAASPSSDMWLRKESFVQIRSDFILDVIYQYHTIQNLSAGVWGYFPTTHDGTDRIKPLTSCKSFPLPSEAIGTLEDLTKMVEKSLVTAIDEGIPYKVETDASEVTLVAALSQDGETVAFFSHSLQG